MTIEYAFLTELEKIASKMNIHKIIMPATEGAILGSLTGAILIPKIGKTRKARRKNRKRAIIAGLLLGATKKGTGHLISRGYAGLVKRPYKDLLL